MGPPESLVCPVRGQTPALPPRGHLACYCGLRERYSNSLLLNMTPATPTPPSMGFGRWGRGSSMSGASPLCPAAEAP